MFSGLAMHTAGDVAAGATSLGFVATIALIAFLLIKVLLVDSDRPRMAVLSQHVDVTIMPLLIVFVAIFAMNVVSHLEAS